MTRDINDPRVAEVIRVFHRYTGSSYSCAEQFTVEYVNAIMGDGYVNDRMFGEGWPTESLLAVLTAYLLNAPEEDVDVSVAVARAQLACLFFAERQESVEEAGGFIEERFDYPTVLKTEWQRYQDEQEAQVAQ